MMLIAIFSIMIMKGILTFGIVPFEKNNVPLEIVTHKVFLDISFDYAVPKRIHIALFGNTMPRVVENFRSLCTGEKGKSPKNVTLHLKGTKFSRLQRYSWIEGGDLLDNECNEGESIYGKPFFADNYNLGHNSLGYVAMRAKDKKLTSIFYITSRKLDQFNNINPVFGKVLYKEEREWIRNHTRYLGNEHGEKHFMRGDLHIILPNIEITDSGELPVDGSENYILNPDLHKKDDL